MISTISGSRLIFYFTVHVAENGETEGTVTSQASAAGEYLPNYSRVSAEIAIPKKQNDDEVMGLFVTQLPEYPYAVEMTLESSKNGVKQNLITLRHKGGNVTIPYIAEKDSELILSIAGRTVARQTVD